MQEICLEFFEDFGKPATADDESDPDEKPFDEKDFGWALGWKRAREIGTLFVRYGVLPSEWYKQGEAERHDLFQFIEGVAWGSKQRGGNSMPAPSGGSDETREWLELM